MTAPQASAPDRAGAPRWVVLKFGGTSVSSRARWDTIATLAQARRAEGKRVLVVVSALSGVTNALQALIDAAAPTAASTAAAQGLPAPAQPLPAQAQALPAAVQDLPSAAQALPAAAQALPAAAQALPAAAQALPAAAQALLESLWARHRDLAVELGLDAEAVLGARFATLRGLLADPRRGDAALQWQAEVLALGELLSSTLGHAYLRARGLALGWVDARAWLSAAVLPHQSAWAARLSAACAPVADADWQRRFAAQGELLLTQGFIAGDGTGGTVLLGRGGSDTSAACLGVLLDAACVEIWTDVPGMFSANPRRVPEARLLTGLDYDEAQEIATTGARVLHPRCIGPCREAGVPIRIRDTAHPQLPGTTIGHRDDLVPGVKAISTRRGLVLVSMETIGMWQQVGFLADVFEQFKRHGLSVDMLGSSETNVTVSLDPSENLVSSNVLEALCADLAQVCRVKVIAPCSAVTLVGRGMRSMLHRLSDVLAEFGRERVHLISQSSNDLNLTFVVDEEVADDMLPQLHELLIHAGAMPVHEASVFGPDWRSLAQAMQPTPAPWWQLQRQALLRHAAQGTPCYAYDLGTVRARVAALHAVSAVDRWLYALKANAHPRILRAVYAQGCGLECVSAGEIDIAFDSVPGLDPERVLFTPSFAARAEYEHALRRGAWVTLDSIAPLQQWPELFRGRAIWLRIDPGFGRGHHRKVRNGGAASKFGLPVPALPRFLALARTLDVRVHGLHAHLGSGIVDPGHWGEVLLQLASVAEQVGTASVLNLGGGIGVPGDPRQPRFDLAALQERLATLRASYPHYALWMEPGRYLVAEAGVLLLRATQVVEKDGVVRIGADAGMNALLRPALYNAWHQIVNLTRLEQPSTLLADVVGPVCESGDVLGRRRRLPATVEGDVLLVAHAGAYGMTMASTYNGRALPVEVVLDAAGEDARRQHSAAAHTPTPGACQ